MKILIYGGTGYLGLSLANYLKEENKITIISRKNKFKDKNSKKINFINLKQKNKILSKIKCSDYIIISNGPSYKNSKTELFHYISYLYNEIQLIKKYKKKNSKLIFLSSIHIYESKYKKKIDVNDNLFSKSYYGIRNILGENIILKEFGQFSKNFYIIRISNIFGILNKSKVNINHSMFKLAVNQFCLKTAKNDKILIKSNKFQRRNYVSINDFVKFIKLLMIKKNRLPNIINYTSNKTFSLNNIMQIIKYQSSKLNLKDPKIYFLNKIKNSNINYTFNNKVLNSNKLNPKIKLDNEIFHSLDNLKQTLIK